MEEPDSAPLINRLEGMHIQSIPPGLYVLAVLIITIPILYLFSNLFLGWSQSVPIWPYIIIIPSFIVLIVGMLFRDNPLIGLLIFVGCVVLSVGLLLLYQSLLEHYESWSYAWSLILPVSPGIAMEFYGAGIKQKTVEMIGVWITRIGLFLFFAFGIFFELVIRISTGPQGYVLLILVLVGVIWRVVQKVRAAKTAV